MCNEHKEGYINDCLVQKSRPACAARKCRSIRLQENFTVNLTGKTVMFMSSHTSSAMYDKATRNKLKRNNQKHQNALAN